MPSFFSSNTLDSIADTLVDSGYIVLDLKDPLMDTLSQHIQKIDNFSKASIGRKDTRQNNQSIRNDESVWLDECLTPDRDYLQAMKGLQEGLNQRLYLGLKYHEAHYAHYKAGSFYKKHRDAFKGKSSRKITTVLYLNKQWQIEDGGCLILYDKNDTIKEEIIPSFARMLIFLSEDFPHEVPLTHKDRYSIAGWFRID